MGCCSLILFLCCCVLASYSKEASIITVPPITYLKPVSVTKTNGGQNVTIYELGGDLPAAKSDHDVQAAGSFAQKRYFFTPAATLRRSAATRVYNATTMRHEVRFMVDVWSEAVKDELSSVTGIPRDLLFVYPANSVELVAKGPGWDRTRYTRPKKRSNSSDDIGASGEIEFFVSCKREEDCEEFLQRLQRTGCTMSAEDVLLEFELRFLDYSSAAKAVAMSVSVQNHVMLTATYQNIVEKGSGKVLLVEPDLLQFAEEVADRIVGENENKSGLHLDFTSPEEAMATIKAGLTTGKVNSSSVADWNRVLWDQVDLANRPDKVVEALNRDFWRGQSSLSSTGARRGPGGLGWLTTYANFIEWRGRRFGMKPSMYLYTINATRLICLERIGDITVDIYPPDGVLSFPVTIIATDEAQSSSFGSSNRREHHARRRFSSVVFGDPIVPIVLAALVVLIGGLSYLKRHRVRPVASHQGTGQAYFVTFSSANNRR